MKAITLIQPWATLIAFDEKKIETRSWKTNYRGQLLIHAGMKIDRDICALEPFRTVLDNNRIGVSRSITTDKIMVNLPTGMIIAKCNLIDCIEMTGCTLRDFKIASASLANGQIITGNELEFGDYAPRRYAWILKDIEMLKKPIPAKGKLSIWEYDFEKVEVGD